MVQSLLELRSALRHQGRYETADAIRAALTAAGLEVRDDPSGTHWARRD